MSRPDNVPGGAERRTRQKGGLVQSTLLVASLAAIAVLFNGVAAVAVTRQLGPSGRGAFVLCVAIANLTTVVVALGTNLAARHHLVRPGTQLLLGHYLGLGVALVAIECVVAGFIGWFSLPLAGVDGGPETLVLVTLAGGAGAASYLLMDALNAFGFLPSSAAVNSTGSGLQLVLVAFLILTGRVDFRFYLLAYILSLVVQAVLAGWLITRRGMSVRPIFSRQASSLLIRDGISAMGTNVGQSLVFRLDRYLIGVLAGASAVGVYSVAATLSEILRIVPSALGQVFFHRTASARISHSTIARGRKWMLCIMAVLVAGIGAAAPFIVEFLVGPRFAGSVTPLRILLIGELWVMSFNIDSRVLSGLGKFGKASLAAWLGVVVVGMLDLILIPTFLLVGAAVASAIAYASMGGAARWFLWSHERKTRLAPNPP